mgnify:CR=1 FL=1
MKNRTKKKTLSILYMNLINSKNGQFNKSKFNLINSFLKEDESFKVNSNTTTNINSHKNPTDIKNITKEKFTPKKIKINTDFTKKYKKVYPILKTKVISNLKEKSKYKNSINVMSSNSSYYKMKNNQTVTPKSIMEFIPDNHCHKNNYSESFKTKDNEIKSFKLKKIEMKTIENPISLKNNSSSSYKKRLKNKFFLDNCNRNYISSHFKYPKKSKSYYLDSLYKEKNQFNLYSSENLDINSLLPDTKKNFYQKFKKIDIKKINSSAKENNKTKNKAKTKKAKPSLRRNNYNDPILNKISKTKSIYHLPNNFDIKKNLSIPFDTFIHSKNKKINKTQLKKISQKKEIYKNKINNLHNLDLKKENENEKKLNINNNNKGRKSNSLIKYKMNLLKPINKNMVKPITQTNPSSNSKKLVFDDKNKSKKEKGKEKEKEAINKVNGSEDFLLKKLLEVFISLTPDKIIKAENKNKNESSDENNSNQDKNSKKKLGDLFDEIKKVEEEKKKIIQKKKAKDINDRIIQKPMSDLIEFEMTNKRIQKKIEIMDEESNMRIRTYNRFFKFIFDTLEQINSLAHNVNIENKNETKEEKKLNENEINKFDENNKENIMINNNTKDRKGVNNMDNNIEESLKKKNSPVKTNSSNSDSSSFLISSINDDFYKKLLDITRSIINSTTIPINDNYNEDNYSYKEQNEIKSPEHNEKNKNIFMIHPNEILNKIKFQCKTDYKTKKFGFNVFHNKNFSEEIERGKNVVKIDDYKRSNLFSNIDNNSKLNCFIF